LPPALLLNDVVRHQRETVKAMSEDHSREDPPEVLPAGEPQRRRLTCWYCGSDDLSRGLKLGLPAEAGVVGVKFEGTGKFLGISLLGTEPLRVTLCNQCGTVVRLSVQDPERKWF
jgi:hypothetical protein